MRCWKQHFLVRFAGGAASNGASSYHSEVRRTMCRSLQLHGYTACPTSAVARMCRFELACADIAGICDLWTWFLFCHHISSYRTVYDMPTVHSYQ
jgi:hypothetical protein